MAGRLSGWKTLFKIQKIRQLRLQKKAYTRETVCQRSLDPFYLMSKKKLIINNWVKTIHKVISRISGKKWPDIRQFRFRCNPNLFSILHCSRSKINSNQIALSKIGKQNSVLNNNEISGA